MTVPPVLACLFVGLLWGATNPLIKHGSLRVAARKRGTAASQGWLADWMILLSTPSYLVPQTLNFAGSVAFIALLGSGVDISVAVPTANATSLASNAVMDMVLGERYQLQLLVPGLMLVAGGLILCAQQ